MTNARAFTLIEVVITLGIAVAMLFALVQFFLGTNKQFSYQKNFIEVAQGADEVAVAVAELALPADQVLASRSFGGTTYSSSATVLVLEMPAIDTSGVTISGTYDYAVFHVSNGKLYRTIEAGSGSSRRSGTRILSEQVQSLSFTYDSVTWSDVRTVTVTVSTSAGGVNHSVTQVIRLRNAAS